METQFLFKQLSISIFRNAIWGVLPLFIVGIKSNGEASKDVEADQLPIRRRQHDRNEADGHEPHGGAEDGGPAAVQIADPAAESRPQ